jgi:hypothetical protein
MNNTSPTEALQDLMGVLNVNPGAGRNLGRPLGLRVVKTG